MNDKFVKLFLICLLLSINHCRFGSKKAECNEQLKKKEGASFCGGGLSIAAIGLIDPKTNRISTDDTVLNIILIDCLQLYHEQEKCKDASSYQPTIY